MSAERLAWVSLLMKAYTAATAVRDSYEAANEWILRVTQRSITEVDLQTRCIAEPMRVGRDAEQGGDKQT